MKSIKEEIKRIKKLFSDDLLWGNLIKESNPDTSGDGVIDSVEFTASGNDITGVEAIEFIQANDYTVMSKDPTKSPEKNVQNICFSKENMQKIYTQYNSTLGNTILSNFNSSAGMCYYYAQRRTVIPVNQWGIHKIAFWDDNSITFYVKLKVPINLSTEAEARESLEGLANTDRLHAFISTNELMGNNVQIEYIKYDASYDYNNNKYSTVKFGGFYSAGLKKEGSYYNALATFLSGGSGKGYNPKTGASTRLYATALDLKSILGSEGLDIGEDNGTGDQLINALKTPHV